ncbi:MAG: hypothetical protein Q9M23_06015, partial [Mariprofundaceae bacterium]|nr:hypothetical protein [Mariprofundaceae bacterium]
ISPYVAMASMVLLEAGARATAFGTAKLRFTFATLDEAIPVVEPPPPPLHELSKIKLKLKAHTPTRLHILNSKPMFIIFLTSLLSMYHPFRSHGQAPFTVFKQSGELSLSYYFPFPPFIDCTILST